MFKAIIADYLASKEFEGLRERTKSDYQKQIGKIERAFGDLPLAALDDPEVTKEFLSWRDRIPSPKQADYAWTVLMLVIAWGRKVGMTSYRPPGPVNVIKLVDASGHLGAPEPLQWALIFAAETAQRMSSPV